MAKAIGKTAEQRLGEVIRRRRLQFKSTQEEMAEAIGVHRTYLSDIERGTRNITISVLLRIAIALDLKVSRVFALMESSSD